MSTVTSDRPASSPLATGDNTPTTYTVEVKANGSVKTVTLPIHLRNATPEQVGNDLVAGKIDVEQFAAWAASRNAKASNGALSCKRSEKGAVSVYGLQRMPVTLYAGQWERLNEFMATVMKFIAAHHDELSWK